MRHCRLCRGEIEKKTEDGLGSRCLQSALAEEKSRRAASGAVTRLICAGCNALDIRRSEGYLPTRPICEGYTAIDIQSIFHDQTVIDSLSGLFSFAHGPTYMPNTA
jgi:hypothetical protein